MHLVQTSNIKRSNTEHVQLSRCHLAGFDAKQLEENSSHEPFIFLLRFKLPFSGHLIAWTLLDSSGAFSRVAVVVLCRFDA
jgi:hypothetical protein